MKRSPKGCSRISEAIPETRPEIRDEKVVFVHGRSPTAAAEFDQKEPQQTNTRMKTTMKVVMRRVSSIVLHLILIADRGESCGGINNSKGWIS